MRNEPQRAVARRLLPIYDACAPFQRNAETVASCARGCSSCCYQWIGITLAEAVLLVDWVQRRPEWQGRIAALREAACEQAAFVATLGKDPNEAFMSSKRGCLFLDKATGDCSAYEARPLMCRIHYAVGDPSHCHPDAEDDRVALVNPKELLAEAVPWVVAATQGIPLATGGMAELVVAAFELLERTPEEFERWLKTVAAEETPPTTITFEELRARLAGWKHRNR